MHSTPQEDEFIFGILTRKKTDSNKRIILNLKNFNRLQYYKYLKIESTNNITELELMVRNSQFAKQVGK